MTERTVPEKAVLLVDETHDDEDGEHCDGLMNVAPASDRAELFVTFPADPTERVGFTALGMGRQPAKRGVVVVGNTVGAHAGDPDYTDPLAEAHVTSTADLRGLGQRISEFCQAWHDQGHQIGVCIDGLGDLLAANDDEDVFQFFHVLTNRLAAVGATTHVHVDPDRVPQRTRLTFEQLFDETTHEEVELDALVPSGSDRASDADVADAVGDDGTGHEREATSEASDDDIADALPD
ncbi:hypothetical protein G9C85_09160 [Halorubellus sp. JP-L1]|uniref:DUF7504 family protein n=1 Tax=Halorubellus sp. JP-L1 TaxID=2715753 RepID=UPI0014095998|nr:hypothetical protein [Halorubellus sp. JP-L1]NHN41796.1 hypothetical protein [Halorubellus sp. JP-L1]